MAQWYPGAKEAWCLPNRLLSVVEDDAIRAWAWSWAGGQGYRACYCLANRTPGGHHSLRSPCPLSVRLGLQLCSDVASLLKSSIRNQSKRRKPSVLGVLLFECSEICFPWITPYGNKQYSEQHPHFSMAQDYYSRRAGRRKHREAVWLLLNNLCVYCWLQAVICWMGIQWMGVEGSVCLGVCVCLFLFIDEIDTWKCVFVCLRMQVIVFFPFLSVCAWN